MKTEKIICRILIVDDDNDLCDVMKAILFKKCPIHIEHTLTEAESHVRQIDPMIVFLDNNLPDGVGIDHIRAIKKLCPHVAIVLMTADTTPNLEKLALLEGATQFIAKPFSANSLKEVVYTICPTLGIAI
jgi:two-component system, OmpR family, response regulator